MTTAREQAERITALRKNITSTPEPEQARPDRVLLRVLMEEYGGEVEDWTELRSLRRVVAALGDAHLLTPKGATREEWGVRYGDGEVSDEFPTRGDASDYVDRLRTQVHEGAGYDLADYEPMVVVRRHRTVYPDRVTKWQPAAQHHADPDQANEEES